MRTVRSIWLILAQAIVFAFGLVIYLLGRSVPEPYYQTQAVVYPLLIFFNGGIFLPAISISQLIFLIFSWRSRSTKIKWIASFQFFLGLSLIGVTLWQFFITANFSHRDSITFNQYTYNVAVASGYVLGHDCHLIAYIVYECDSLGIVCRRIDTPYLESYEETGCTRTLTGEESADFLIDASANSLSLQVGSYSAYPVK